MIHNALTAFTMAGAFLFRTGAVRLIAMFFFHKPLLLLWIIYNFAVLPAVRHKYLYGWPAAYLKPIRQSQHHLQYEYIA